MDEKVRKLFAELLNSESSVAALVGEPGKTNRSDTKTAKKVSVRLGETEEPIKVKAIQTSKAEVKKEEPLKAEAMQAPQPVSEATPAETHKKLKVVDLDS